MDHIWLSYMCWGLYTHYKDFLLKVGWPSRIILEFRPWHMCSPCCLRILHNNSQPPISRIRSQKHSLSRPFVIWMCKVLPFAKTSSIYPWYLHLQIQNKGMLIQAVTFPEDRWYLVIHDTQQSHRRCHQPSPSGTFWQMVATSEGGRAYKLLKRHTDAFHLAKSPHERTPEPSKDLTTPLNFLTYSENLMVGRWNFFLKNGPFSGDMFILIFWGDFCWFPTDFYWIFYLGRFPFWPPTTSQ